MTTEEWNIKGVEFEKATDLIESNYAGQFPRQMPIFISVKWETKEIWAYTDGSGNMTFDELHGLTSTYNLSDGVDASELKNFVVDKLIPVLDGFVGKFSVKWDGNNHVADWEVDEYGQMPFDLDGLANFINEQVPETNQGGLWEFGEWMNGYYQEIFDEIDEGNDLETIVERYFEEALNEGVVFEESVDSVVETIEEEYEEYKEENEE